MKISAVIFDLDGTVLDNEDEYGIAFRKVLRSLGKKTDNKYPQTGGLGVKENWPILLAKYKIKTNKSLEELTKQTQDAYLELLSQVTTKKGFQRFAKDLNESGIVVCLATSNSWNIVDKVFEKLNLKEYFSVLTTGEEVDHKKPDPGIFLEAARKIDTPAEECLVFEDSAAGIEAAKRAGMKVVGIYRDQKHSITLKEADMLISGYTNLGLNKLSKIGE